MSDEREAVKAPRDALATAMFAAWVNCAPDQIPSEYRGHTCPATMAAWKRVGEAALAYFEEHRLVASRDDTARLDFLDECSRRLNAHYGTTYGWALILNHNVNRLMLGHLEVDLNDAAAGIAKLSSCRAAIDLRMGGIEANRRIAAAHSPEPKV